MGKRRNAILETGSYLAGKVRPLVGAICLLAIASYAFASQVVPYAAPWSAPWQIVSGLGRASEVANAAIRLGVVLAVALLVAWPYPSLNEKIVHTQPTGYEMTPTPYVPTSPFTLPDLTWLWITLGAATLALMAVILVRAIRRRASRAASGATNRVDEIESLGSWAAESLSAIQSERDPRRAVLACYALMERRLATVGLLRNPEETAREYAKRVLARLGAPSTPLAALTELYHLAGYSRYPINEAMRQSAIDSLRTISEAAT